MGHCCVEYGVGYGLNMPYRRMGCARYMEWGMEYVIRSLDYGIGVRIGYGILWDMEYQVPGICYMEYLVWDEEFVWKVEYGWNSKAPKSGGVEGNRCLLRKKE